MKRYHTYIQFTLLQLLGSLFIGLWLPTVLFDKPLVPQLLLTALILILFRAYAFYMIRNAFDAFQRVMKTLEETMPLSSRQELNISFDIYRSAEARQSAQQLENALRASMEEQRQMNLRYATINMALERHVEARETMLDIANDLIYMEDTASFFDLILNKAITIAPSAGYGSFLVVDENNRLRYTSAKGFDLESLRPVSLKIHESFLKKSDGSLHTKPFIIEDLYAYNAQIMRDGTDEILKKITGPDIKSTLSAPIYIEDQLYGLVNLDCTDVGCFTEEDLIFMEYFVTQISIAVQNRQLVERAMYLSRYDKLTGIYNRGHFEEKFYNYHERAIHGEEPFILVLMDLNNLKTINDRFGHIAGDQSLKLFVRELKRRLPEEALLARFGGDEFICILPGLSQQEASESLEAITAAFEQVYLEFNYSQIPIRFSYGIASSPDESMVLDILVKLADSRMYEHKAKMKAKTPFPFVD